MDDDSDDGQLPGQSFFKNKNNEIEEKESNENDIYDENYEEQYYQQNENYDYQKNDDDYYNGSNYESFDNNKYYESEDSNYFYSNNYENDNSNYNNYSNFNKNKKKNYYKKYENNNKNFEDNYKYKSNCHRIKNNYPKTKESYITSFEENFKLWLMLVVKISSIKKKIKLTENKKVNKEIIEAFLKIYDIESNNNKKEKEKNNLSINIKNFEIKQTVGKFYIIEFSLIIKDRIDIFFVDKYIEIKVIGEIFLERYPKFIFNVKKYILSLNYNKKEKNKYNEENGDKPEKENEKKEKEINNNIIENMELNENDKYTIDMNPEYSINDETFKQYYLKINGKENIKDPHKEMRDCLDNLTNFL